MWRRYLVLAVVILVGIAGGLGWHFWGGTSEAALPPWTDDMQAVAEANNRFALDMYAQLREEKGNLFFSPYSIHTALSMTAVGARGTTRDQMLKLLHLPDEKKLLAAGDLGRFYSARRKGYELSVANAIWGRKGFGWNADFVAIQNERFGTGFQEADFAGNPDGERKRINRWVEDKTHDRIKELLLPGQITGGTTMVLANAIYFKGKWATEFTPSKTREADFHLDDGSRVRVQMMHTNAKCGIAGGNFDGVWGVELPYRGDELSMVVLLPQKHGQTLSEFEQQLTPLKLADYLNHLKDRGEYEVSLPRFEFESRFEVLETLGKLGLTDASDFSGMGADPGALAHVSHKAFVKVNEEGTEAAAATAAGMVTSGPPSFYANRPFLFLIRDVKRGTILFMGRFERP
ncbi:MAG: serpin family protein [Gemmataceae bacterium]